MKNEQQTINNINVNVDSNLSIDAQMDLAFKAAINLQKAKIFGSIITLSMAKSISKKLEEIFVKYMMERTLVKKFTGVKTTRKEITKTLLGLQHSLVFETDQGLVGIAHGTEDGAVGYPEVDCNGQPQLHRIEIESEEFLSLFPEVAPGQEMYLVSCFPGAKPKEWKVQGRTFKNLGTEFKQLHTVLDEEKGELYVGYGSPKMAEHWNENNIEEAGQLVAQALQVWLSEGYSMDEICEFF